jgi:uncharacterized DUF497 family protein
VAGAASAAFLQALFVSLKREAFRSFIPHLVLGAIVISAANPGRRFDFYCIYDIIVQLEFDPAKNARNIRERGISLERFADMDLETAVAIEDARIDYGERRVRLFGNIDDRLHVAVITYRGDTVRVISLRRANDREERKYAKRSQSS